MVQYWYRPGRLVRKKIDLCQVKEGRPGLGRNRRGPAPFLRRPAYPPTPGRPAPGKSKTQKSRPEPAGRETFRRVPPPTNTGRRGEGRHDPLPPPATKMHRCMPGTRHPHTARPAAAAGRRGFTADEPPPTPPPAPRERTDGPAAAVRTLARTALNAGRPAGFAGARTRRLCGGRAALTATTWVGS